MRVSKLCSINEKALGLVIAVIMTVLLTGQLMAQPPLGAGNEVWVDVPDTVYVGQDVELPVYFANDDDLASFSLGMKVVSTDGAQWDWRFQSEPPWPNPEDSVVISLNHDSRFWGDNLEFPYFDWGYCYESLCAFELGALSTTLPEAPAGPLEKALTIHLKPTSPGTIAVDTARWPPATDQWHFIGAGGFVAPAWNGPFSFTVVESTALGDVNCDGSGNLGDAVYIINWIFKGGPEPCR